MTKEKWLYNPNKGWFLKVFLTKNFYIKSGPWKSPLDYFLEQIRLSKLF